MTWKFHSFATFAFVFFFSSFLAVHYAVMKTPSPSREIASFGKAPVQPWYDASFKY